MLNSKVYDGLKQVALVWLPALATFYFAVAGIWHLPDADQVVGSITALDTLLGVVLHVSNSNYEPPVDGKMVVDPEAGKISMEMETDPEQITTLKEGSLVTFKVAPKA
jgi:Putative phage holin Dp-1